MKILYGVQGTGNGHISRANAMHDAFKSFPNVDVTWLLSSRPRDQGMGTIESFEWRKGLSFVARDGRVNMWDSLRQAELRQCWRDIKDLDLSPYDVVVTDFEPVVAHAARRRGIPVIGIGHQYAFLHRIPRRGDNMMLNSLMRQFAPVTRPVGLHWHHFEQPDILPPIVHLSRTADPTQAEPDKIVAYLPFENALEICELFRRFPDKRFFVYHPQLNDRDEGNLCLRRISHEGFKADLFTAAGVVCNSGFELISECLQWQKKIFAKPLGGQMEQLSNAAALEQLGYATVVDTLDAVQLRRWLDAPPSPIRIHYPDVAKALARWIVAGQREEVRQLAHGLWEQSSLPFAGSAQSRINARR